MAVPELDVCICEHIDMSKASANGIDTIIRGFVKFGPPDLEMGIVAVTSDAGERLGIWREIEFEGRRVWYLPVAVLDGPRLMGRLRIPNSLRLAAGMVRFRRRLPRTVFQAHRVETGVVLLALRRGPVCQFVHNTGPRLRGKESESVWRRLAWAHRLVEGIALRKAMTVTAFCGGDESRLRRIRSSTRLAQTWYDPEVFRPRDDGGPSDAAVLDVCWVGRLDASKDPFLALRVMEELRSAGTSATLTMIGDGILEGAVREEIRRRNLESVVHVLGPLPRTAVAATMAASRVLLVTSHFEGSPTVLVEANAVGIPVVATPEADPEGSLVTDRNGERAASRDPADLAAALKRATTVPSASCLEAARPRAAPGAPRRVLEGSLSHRA